MMEVILELEEMCLDAESIGYWAAKLDDEGPKAAAAVVIPAYVMRSSPTHLIRRLNVHSWLVE